MHLELRPGEHDIHKTNRDHKELLKISIFK
jgi:hypothetical protein